MYKMGNDDLESQLYLAELFRQIGHIAEVGEQLKEPPSSDSEIMFLSNEFADAPVALYRSLSAALNTAIHALTEIRVRVETEPTSVIGVRSLLRAALLGSCRASFVLTPTTRAERIKNAGRVLRYEADQLVGATNNFKKFEHLGALIPSEEVLSDYVERSQKLSKSSTNETTLIMEFAKQAGQAAKEYDPTTEPRVLEENLTWIWRTTSAAVHGLGWVSMVPDGNFISDLGAVVSAGSVAVEAAEKAWNDPLPS